MKKLKTTILSCLIGIVAVNAEAGEKFVITGDMSSVYKSGDMVIWSPEKKKSKKEADGKSAAKPAAAMTMGSSMSMSSASSGSQSMRDNLNILAEGKLVDGKFRIEGEVDNVQQVYFYVLDAVGEDGSKRAPTKGQGFILEPGELTMAPYNAGFSKFAVSGGKYNDAVYNSWRMSEEYKAAAAEMKRLYTEVAGETEEEKRTRLDKASEAQSKMFDLEAEGRNKVATTHPDVLARKLAIQTAWLGGRWMLDAAYTIREMAPEDKWVNEYIASQEAYYAKRAKNDQIGRIGSGIKDFDAETLEGKVISLKDVRSKNKYVLLEFWASWCGPCRAEIPHMKKAYEKYHDKGFEIFSFTIDDDKDAWETASGEENLPWIDTGHGSESEPKKLYEVMGVPANYLVDGETGEVIARNLRGHKLDEKLKELLD
ncbi:TlpA disulfide reductase family protein [Porticoccaceae bacterium LTM1]|nr:TlpA disulfide reductase family protein [Porticoccaceae bacterium LTM1]